MVSTKPYLIRAIHEWCMDQGFTPYLTVEVDESTRVPREFVRDGQIVLNVSTDATNQLMMGNEEISFQTRFNGNVFPVLVPVEAVSAIYARENGQGMAFEVRPAAPVVPAGDDTPEQSISSDRASPDAPETPQNKRGGHLTRVK